MEHSSMFAKSYEFYDGDNATGKAMNPVSGLSLHGKMSSPSPTAKRGPEQQTVLLPSQDEHGIVRSDSDKAIGYGDKLDTPSSSRSLPPNQRGHFHTYRAARPLKLVYIDGMAAAKCPVGTLDSQDYILLERDVDHLPSDSRGSQESLRATDLCILAKEWRLDGWIRMEAGFEIIYCDFDEGAGLDLVSVHGSPWRNETGAVHLPVGGDWAVQGVFEWMRAAAAERYHGFPRGRAALDFSSMVSAFAYDVNLTNPDETRPELPRLVHSTGEERQGIKARLGEVLLRDGPNRGDRSVDWQSIVDDIVSRFSHRLRLVATANKISVAQLRSEIATLTYPFLSFPDDAPIDDFARPLQRCADHYLRSAMDSKGHWTPEDHAIHAAISTVSRMACQAVFEMRQTIHSLTDQSVATNDTAVQRTQRIAQETMKQLDWTTWRECGPCSDPLAMCFVAMFPIGADEDHFSPRCKRQEELSLGYFRPIKRTSGTL